MKNHPSRAGGSAMPSVLVAVTLALVLCTSSTLAQTSSAPTPPTPAAVPPPAAADQKSTKNEKTSEEMVTLTAFEVRSDSDENYGALESNSITRFRTDLDTLPVDASVFTKTFMDDVAVTSVEEMLVQYAGAYAGSSDPSANGIAGEAGDRQGSAEFTLGGLKLSVRRDGFVAMSINTRGPVGSTDSFSTERAELILGPQSLLYGGAGGGGIANIVSKQGHFDQRRGSLRYTFDQNGSKRTEVDYNFGTPKFAYRVSLLNTDKATTRYLIDSRAQGAYTQLAFRLPHATTVRLWGQSVDSKSVNSTRLTNIDAFLPTGDPRRGKNPRFLIATGQSSDIRIGDNPINFGNIDSFASRWSGDNIDDKFAGASVETVVTSWLSTQLAVIYEDTDAVQIAPTKTLLAANASGNPFPGEAAVSVATNGSTVSPGPAQKKAIRFSALFEKDFFDRKILTQTITGAEAVTSRSAGINSGYFKADSNWNVDMSGPVGTAYGRTTMPTQYYPIQHGIPKYPLFTPGDARVTINGVNYVLQSLRIPNSSLVSQLNPLGLAGGSGTFTHSQIHTRAYYVGHVTSLFDNRLKFLGGARYDEQSGSQQGITSTGLKNALYEKSKLSYNLGLNYTVRPSVNVFVSKSTAFDPDTSTSDPYGNPLLSSVSHGIQAGVRYSTPEHGMTASLTYSSTVGTNQTQLIDQTWLDAINPAGINGRYTAFAGSDRWVNVDRKDNGLHLQVDLHPTRHWRATMTGIFANGRVASNSSFAQLYNDQFYTDGKGVITYADHTPVLVDPTGGKGAKNTPLTIAMLNDPTSAYRAIPDADSGRITNATLITALTTVDPVHGTAATNVNGLPISAIQYNWTDPYGHNGVLTPVAGNQYSPGPQYSLSFFNHYDFSTGWLKGFGVGAGVSAAWDNYAYYYTVGGTKATAGQRVPFMLPTPATFEYSLTYSRKLGRVTWHSQVNVKNALNHYYYIIVPTASNGVFENARAINTPRLVSWTNSIAF